MIIPVRLSMIALVAALAALSGCETPGRLSRRVEGQWSGVPMNFDKKTMIDGEFTPTFRFERIDGVRNGGNFTMTAMVNVTMPVDAPIDSLGTTPVSASASGLATVSGTWVADDTDDLDLIYDLTTLVVNMDPDVQFEYANIWTSGDLPASSKVPVAVRRAFEKQMTDGLTASIDEIDDLDDISFNKDETMMNCKLDDRKQTLTRIYE